MRKLSAVLLICCIFICSCQQSSLNIVDLKCEYLVNPQGINTTAPRFSWKVKSLENGTTQQSYQLLVASDKSLLNVSKADLWNSGRQESPDCILVPYEGKNLSSRSIGYWKVGIWDQNGKEVWSEPAVFSIGLLQKTDWTADYIALPHATDSIDENRSVCPQLWKSFDWDGQAGMVLLHINSLGYHEIWLNGQKVTEAVLTPAVSQLDKRSLTNTYDLFPYLQKGRNDLVLWLGQGWYRPWIPGCYEAPVVRAQMEGLQDGQWKTIVGTDETWVGRESGYTGTGNWKPHHFGGEIIDANLLLPDLTATSLEQATWTPVIKISVPEHEVSPQMSEFNRIKESIKPKSITRLNDSTCLVDMGKNLTGWFEIEFPALKKGQQITLEYADFEEAFTQNPQIDTYIASGKSGEKFCHKFNYHAFRFVKLVGLTADPLPENITAHLIHTDYQVASSFECSDADMNAIHDMVQYTLRCLSLGGYLVDCTHIERLGYGGDGSASTATAQTMFDLSPLYSNWLQAWADCIREDGGMPHTAPNPYTAGGGPYWCGFIITASWETYQNYGDLRYLEKYYPVMQQWLGYVEKHSPNGLLEPWPNTDYRGWFLGDWATPKGIDQTNPASVGVVNNCFVVQCYETMSKIAQLLNKQTDQKAYAEKSELLQKQIHQAFYHAETHSYGSGSQIDLVYPMLAGVVEKEAVSEVMQTLFQKTDTAYQGHLSCGLVGIPILTEWSIRNQATDFMYSMLKKRDYPGYLYMIDKGATTTWEHWNGDRSQMHNCYNGIGTWFYEAIGGIRRNPDFPAYKQFFIQPQIPKGITWAKASKETPYGTIEVYWTLKQGVLDVRITVPVGSTATLTLPDETGEYTLNGQKHSLKNNKDSNVILSSGRHLVDQAIFLRIKK